MVKILQELIKYHAHHQHDGSALAYEKECDAAETASAKTVVIMTTPKQIAIHIRNLKCRCGERMAKKSSNYIACKDGKKKSRCPCLGYGQGCSSSCECVGCQNVHGARSGSSTIPSGVKRKRSPGIYKREKGYKYLSSAGTPQAQGPWTNYESVLLSSVMKLISLTDVSPSTENYSKLFNFVVGSNLKQHMHSTPSSKTATQIAAKLAHSGKKREVAYARLTEENMP